jgi:hypothetical protein
MAIMEDHKIRALKDHYKAQIKALIKSHLNNDGERFVTVALQLAAHEARQGHVSFAREIRHLIDSKKEFHQAEKLKEYKDLLEEEYNGRS